MKRRLIRITSLVAVAVTALTTGVPNAQATVEPNWADNVPNTPRHPDDIFIDFEVGIDEIQIESTIPSLKFTTTSGLNWKYGDTRTGKYNVFPYGENAYDANGNFFAWLGALGDVGRVDFRGGGATYCSVLVSTGSGVVMDAYNSTDTLIATSGWAGNNLGTRTFTRLTVVYSAGQTIAYVLIHDTGNFWVIDDLCTDANKSAILVPGGRWGATATNSTSCLSTRTMAPRRISAPGCRLSSITLIIRSTRGLAAQHPVTGNLCKFNFYYTKMQGVASSKTLPADLTLLAPFADAFVIFHTTEFGDSTSMGTPSIYGAEGPVGRSFIHESGHGIFGLADGYDGCGTYYFQPNPVPNIWATESDGRADATSQGWI